ncbi:MAG TPA: carotenoid biosynthesis protein, partial [Frankiaceae bacterium]|nr:carotenoid biosynthesis protein [Frankiaceae bacterium]
MSRGAPVARRGPGAGAAGDGRPPGTLPPALPWALAGGAVLAQVAYPLVHGVTREAVTVASVLLWCAASLAHAALTRGARWAGALLAVTAGGGLLAEAVGVRTGVPFGRYTYAGTLGPQIGGVPLVVPLAWTMMAYPALAVGRRIARSPAAAALAGGLALAAWDLFLDPQMVDAGHWRWDQDGPALNGIPVTNTLGWALVGVLMMAALSAPPRRPADDRLPYALYLWAFGSSLLANLAFFDRPGVALAGGLGMGVL